MFKFTIIREKYYDQFNAEKHKGHLSNTEKADKEGSVSISCDHLWQVPIYGCDVVLLQILVPRAASAIYK